MPRLSRLYKRRNSRYNGNVRRVLCVLILLGGVLALLSCATKPDERGERTAAGRHGAVEITPAPSRGKGIAERTPEMEARVERLLDELSTEQLLGQRFMAYVPRDTEGARELETLLEPTPPAGFILYPWNMDNYDEALQVTRELQRATWAKGSPGLLFAADHEGGRVAGLRYPEAARVPSAFQQGLRRDPRYVESASYLAATDLRRAGIRMNLAPVLDVHPREDETIIGDRSFGGDPAGVAELGAAHIRASMEAGVVPVAKHFPGHGVTTVDSHKALPVSDRSLEELRKRDLLPFRRAVEEGVPAVMTAHILYERIDPEYAATLSPRFIRGLLRRELGFDGVVITDGFSMGALTEGFDRREALRQSFHAGVDIVLIHAHYDYGEVFEEALLLLEEEDIDEEMIREGARRVLLLKARMGLL